MTVVWNVLISPLQNKLNSVGRKLEIASSCKRISEQKLDRCQSQFYIQLVYKPHFGTWISLFGLFGHLTAVRKNKWIWVFSILWAKKIQIQSKPSKIGSNQISGGLNFQKVSKKTNIFWKFAQFEWEKSLILTGIYCLPYSSLRGVIWPTLIMYLELCCVP